MVSSDVPPPAGTHLPFRESSGALFRRFLRFGLLAWGGPVAQIDMIRHELVAQERWVTPDYFRRLLGIYQVLPGPEASELCVHFGILARGRWGGVIAGLGFMLPGFVLMLGLSWFHLHAGRANGLFHAVFLGIQPAVIALIVRACHRIGRNCLTDLPLGIISVCAAAAEWVRAPFWLTLLAAGLAYLLERQRRWLVCAVLGVAFVGAVMVTSPAIRQRATIPPATPKATQTDAPPTGERQSVRMFFSGLRAGLLTFGGAYTAIPFLRRDAVEAGGWMTESDFLDGVALSGILPAPLIIFSTFVGFFGGGLWGAIAMTVGIFLPAFVFPILLFRHLDALVEHVLLRHFLEGVTAGVIGLIVVTTLQLGLAAMTNWPSAGIAVAAIIVLYLWNSKFATPAVVLAAGAAGALLFAR